jgi:hypothetical protein
MMRKLIWCGAAVGVLLAGGLFVTWQYARAHPDSPAGRFVIATSGVAVFLNPLAGAGPLVEHVIHHWAPASGSEECVEIAPGDEARWHEEPVSVGKEGGEREVMKLEMAGVLELPATAPPAGPAPIVIPEDDTPPAPPADENADLAPLAAPGIDLNNEVNLVVMPYCEDDRAPAPTHMPYADEGAEPTGAAEAPPARPKHECLKAFFMKLFEKKGDQSGTAEGTEEGEGDYHRYHPDHHPGCPSNYCPYTGRCYPEPATPPKKAHGGEEKSESPKGHPAKHHKGCDKDEGCPVHPDVDTMEYRKSDGRLDDYGPGGPF